MDKALYAMSTEYVDSLVGDIGSILSHYGVLEPMVRALQSFEENSHTYSPDEYVNTLYRIERLLYEAMTLVIMERNGD